MDKEYLTGYDSPENAYVVDDYPYGWKLRCKIRYWIETTKNGDRMCSQTTNPKKPGEIWNKPKKSTYCAVGCLTKDPETGYISWAGIMKGWTENEKIDEFLQKIGGVEKLSKMQKQQLAVCRAIQETNKYLTVKIVPEASMTPEEKAAKEAEQKKTKDNIGKLFMGNLAQENKALGL